MKPNELKKNWRDLIVGVGYGLANCGTKFRFNFDSGQKDSSGNIIYVPLIGSFRFWAPRVMVGLHKYRIDALMIATLTPDREFDKNPSLWLEFKAAYTFKPFEKKK